MMFYQTRKEVGDYEKPRTALPDSVGQRMMSELRRKGKQFNKEDEESFEFELMVDVGCGNGRHSKIFVPYFKKIVGIDYSKMQIERANDLNNYENVEYVFGSGESLPFSDESVDFVTFIFSAFFMDIKKVEEELVRVLKPSGVAVIYGDLVTQLDLLKEDGDVFSSPGSRDIWEECMRPFVEFAIRTSHPERRLLDRHEAISKEFVTLNKRNICDTQYVVERTIENYIEYFCTVPFYGGFARSQNINPFTDLSRKLKELWGIPHAEDSDVTMRITHECFMLFLDKP